MTLSEDAGLNLFINMATIWRRRVPSALRDEPPGTVARALELGLAAPGMSHSVMRSHLGLGQPEMSRIAEKLVDAGWVQVERWKADRRTKLITTTATGRNLLLSIKDDLNGSLSAIAPEGIPSKGPKSSRRQHGEGGKQHEEWKVPFQFPEPLPKDQKDEG